MGASGWQYVVSFEPDLNKALQTLRQKEFEAGRYYQPAVFLDTVLRQGLVEASYRPAIQAAINQRRDWPTPRTIAELQEQNAEDGTHSILDIESISERPSFGTAAPLTEAELTELFGTQKPSLEKVIEKSKAGLLTDLRERWEGLYIITYSRGKPSHIYFSGFSGD